MSKTFDSFQKSTIKNAAKAVAHFQARIDKLDEQISSLEAQKAELVTQVETYNDAVKNLTGGFTPLELCEKVARNGGSNEWVFKYPTTIIPNAEEQSVEETSIDQSPVGYLETKDESFESQEANNELHLDAEPIENEQINNDPLNDIFA